MTNKTRRRTDNDAKFEAEVALTSLGYMALWLVAVLVTVVVCFI